VGETETGEMELIRWLDVVRERREAPVADAALQAA
jgi:hypothetical protein